MIKPLGATDGLRTDSVIIDELYSINLKEIKESGKYLVGVDVANKPTPLSMEDIIKRFAEKNCMSEEEARAYVWKALNGTIPTNKHA